MGHAVLLFHCFYIYDWNSDWTTCVECCLLGWILKKDETTDADAIIPIFLNNTELYRNEIT